jgi:hypothetical protein
MVDELAKRTLASYLARSRSERKTNEYYNFSVSYFIIVAFPGNFLQAEMIKECAGILSI